MSINGLLLGAEEQGLDTAVLEEKTLEAYVRTVDGLDADIDAIAKWERTRQDADPRDLSHVPRADASEDFEPINDEPGGPKPGWSQCGQTPTGRCLKIAEASCQRSRWMPCRRNGALGRNEHQTAQTLLPPSSSCRRSQ